MANRAKRIAVLAAAVAVTVAIGADPAGATGAEVTRGEFQTLPGGAALGYDLAGFAVMVRTPAGDDGTTIVTVHLKGLDPDFADYPTHVHNAPCAATPAGGGHYQAVVGGPVDPVNEIWPTVNATPSGVGRGSATHDHWARPDAQSIVVHYPDNTSIRLACADLG
jgi:hypothetical protein